ncbi:MAG: TRAP transporter substrate-binding protein DctP [Deltaproteobacteria bacterium]|nr:TRAP transporter substrate-binding protein DctP [Deltaproteobacteria bacterium]
MLAVLAATVLTLAGFATATSAADAVKTFQWTFQGQANNDPESAWASEQKKLGDMVRAATNGQIDITYVFDVAKDVQVLDAVKEKKLNLGFMGVHYKPNMTFMNFQSLPIVPNDRLPEILALLKPKFDTLWQKDWGVKLLAFNYYLPQLMYTVKPVDTLEKLKPERIRQFGPDLMKIYARAGCTPIGIPSIQAVQQNIIDGKIDGAQGGLPAYVNWGWAERLKYISNWPLGSTYMALVINLEDWNSLTPDLQQKLVKAAETVEKNQWNSRQAHIDSLINQAMTKYGAKIVNPPQAEVTKLLANVDPVLEDWKKKMGPDSALIFEAVNKVLGTSYK